MSKFLNLLTDVISKVQQDNKSNPKEETAPETLFDRLRDKVKDVAGDVKDKRKGGNSFFEIMRNKVNETQKENKNSKTEKTAQSEIFDRLRNTIDQIEDMDGDGDVDIQDIMLHRRQKAAERKQNKVKDAVKNKQQKIKEQYIKDQKTDNKGGHGGKKR